MTNIGRLTDVVLREIWADEAGNFTPWLAENLDHLGGLLGRTLELEGREVPVGTFSADILARDLHDDTFVLIENQLEKTDHRHLGQIMTYLAGLNAHTVIWIAPAFNESHLSAIRWLNENTRDNFAFFAVRLRAVRIGDSDAAPLLDVVARPDVWEQQTQAATRGSEAVTDAGQFKRAFWGAYRDRHPEDIDLGVPIGGNNWWLKIGSSDLVISLYPSVRGEVGAFVRGPVGEDDDKVRAQVADVLDTVWSELKRRLSASGVEFLHDHELIWYSRRPVDLSKPAGIEEAADLLHAMAHSYRETIAAAIGIEL